MTTTAILTAAEMRAAEERVIAAGTSVETLMDRAGTGAAQAILRFGGGAPTLVVCGPGNNGGDGYVIARWLRDHGVTVHVAALSAPRTSAAADTCAKWDGPVEVLAEAKPSAIFVDALFGTGLTRGLEPDVVAQFARLAGGAKLRVAVDLPSGIGTDDGAILSPVPHFDMTIALGAPKPAHFLQPVASMIGRLVTIDIGLGDLTSQLTRIVRPQFRAPGPEAHKYSRGAAGIIGGAMPGAALLAASAAQRSGAGIVFLADDDSAGGAAALIRADETAVLADDRLGALIVGPGLGRDADARARLDRAIATGHALICDADALTLMGKDVGARLAGRTKTPILTPHAGEFRRMFGDLSGSKIEQARIAAQKAGAVIVYKGADTVIAAPDGRVAMAGPAPSWLASAGTGDVLAGIIGAMVAQGLPAFEAAQAAVWLHGEAARRAGPMLIADDLVAHLQSVAGDCL